MIDVASAAETPMISMAASSRIVDPEPKTKWVFKTPQSDALMADAIAVHMKVNGVKTLGFIGFADGYGDGWLAELAILPRPQASRSSPRRSTTVPIRRLRGRC
jgi:branched-chain amino acid transport system substrate-binding protein